MTKQVEKNRIIIHFYRFINKIEKNKTWMIEVKVKWFFPYLTWFAIEKYVNIISAPTSSPLFLNVSFHQTCITLQNGYFVLVLIQFLHSWKKPVVLIGRVYWNHSFVFRTSLCDLSWFGRIIKPWWSNWHKLYLISFFLNLAQI